VGGTCGTHGRREQSVQGFGGKARCKRPLGRPMRRYEDELRIDLTVRESGWGCVGKLSWFRVGTGCELL
jgi:hypothetical protein